MTNGTYGQAYQSKDVLDRRTLLLAGFSLFVFGCFLGCALYRFFGIGKSELYDKLIERYFLALYQKCAGPLDVFSVTLDCIAHELWLFIIVFVSGFTPFSPPVGAVIMLYRGLLFGFSVTLLQFSTKAGLLLTSGIYLLCAFAISGLLALMCAEAVRFYDNTPKLHLRSIAKTSYTLTFLRICALTACCVICMLFLIYVYI